jgi:glutamate N-acetyltransferase/amino-acid N-acetyltransferase
MSVTTPAGFRAAGVAAGIKESGRPDVALVVNDGPRYAAAGRVTRNRIKAAPVLWTEQVARGGRIGAVVLNSGNANACTGPDGFADVHHTAELVGDLLGIGPADVAVCSTGIIGVRLPTDRLFAGIRAAHAALDPDGGPAAAEAIMTTDTVPKQVARTASTGWRLGGMAKGAGMLAPELATMLVVLTTDADLEPHVLDAALGAATAVTFERLDTDGCLSTNDTVVLLASGASGVRPEPEEFTAVLVDACADLAHQLAADAEGAGKLITVEVRGAASEPDAVQVARAVARSNLVKCAIGGGDPNWGRILAAIGTTTARFEPDGIDVAINGVQVCRHSAIGEDRTKVDLSGRDVTITIDLHAGAATARLLTTDLTAAYVHENSAYST